MRRYISLWLAIFFFVIPTYSLAGSKSIEDNALKLGLNKIFIEQEDGLLRKVLIEIPRKKPTNGYAVVFGFHGAGGKAEAYNRRLSSFVKKHSIISVSPLGTYSPQSKAVWNFKENSRSQADDIALVFSIVELLKKQGLIDMQRIYATGSSSGGLMTYRLAREKQIFLPPLRQQNVVWQSEHMNLKKTRLKFPYCKLLVIKTKVTMVVEGE